MEHRYVCQVDDVEPGSSMTVAGEPPIALFRNDAGDYYATDDTCTHEQWSLGEDSDLDGYEVVCPLHMARFDIRSGKAMCFPATDDLATYVVEVSEDGRVYIVVGQVPVSGT